MSYITSILENIKPFLEDGSFERFSIELNKIPNWEKAILKLLSVDPKWIEDVSRTGESYFLLEEIEFPYATKELPKNELELKHFHMGACPTLKVTTYCRNKYLGI